MHRRDFCKWSLLTIASASGIGCTGNGEQAIVPGISGILSGCDDQQGQHYIAHLSQSGEFLARIPVPQRVHGSVYVPQQNLALFFARRPGTHLYILDTHSGELVHTLENTADRHFYGHGVISNDGSWLYTTENNMKDLSGIIGVYSLQGTPTKVAEFSSGGIGPHQLALMPDGNTLVIANGGMATHPASGREALNLGTMAPNLAYLNLADGHIIETHEPPHHKMSIRHLDVASDGQVVFGVQHQGDLTDVVPLVGSHQQGQAIQWLELPETLQLKIKQYTASVAVDEQGDTALVSCPRGNLIGCWDIRSGHFVQQLQSHDAAGLFRAGGDAWISSNGVGEVSLLSLPGHINKGSTVSRQSLSASGYRWDNHLTVI